MESSCETPMGKGTRSLAGVPAPLRRIGTPECRINAAPQIAGSLTTAPTDMEATGLSRGGHCPQTL
jgi:hypothetical protein